MDSTLLRSKAKESADGLIAEKNELDAEKIRAEKTAQEAREALRIKAAGVGNIVYKDVPVSLTEVSWIFYSYIHLARDNSVDSHNHSGQDDNQVIRTWHPEGANGQVQQRTDILAHHEVLLRLDAIDLERGAENIHSSDHCLMPKYFPSQVPKSLVTEGIS